MFTTDLDFQKDLAAHHVFTSWQFIQYTQKNIHIVEYCANILGKSLKKCHRKRFVGNRTCFQILLRKLCQMVVK